MGRRVLPAVVVELPAWPIPLEACPVIVWELITCFILK